ncbi:MAG: NADH-quinone oxidoreductase subunit J [Nitrospira sp.]|nr:NADH-quinone oxidoreductase subunit J [Nitrospira sp.]MDH4303351.1 NADH-quinone oxidoreductase subunit J [Nitrospira sp.]MDH5192661.1 NADH-quinone oxidoreductase subunit J [Nitrospira sp.]
MSHLFFGYFAVMIVATSILVVALKNPVYSALSLLVMFFHVAGLFVTLHAEFLAAVQIIVYAGAILVLYLFVVMILNVKQDDRYHSQWRIAGFVCVPLLIEAMVLLSGGAGSRATGTRAAHAPSAEAIAPDNTLAIGQTLFSTYLFPFEVASLVLLVAMIGAIVLAKREIGEPDSASPMVHPKGAE